MKSFSNEALNFFFRMFWFLLYFRSCQNCMSSSEILSQKFTRNFVIKKLWTLENYVLVNMLLSSSHFHWNTKLWRKSAIIYFIIELVILVRIFPVFSRIRTEYGEILQIQTLFTQCSENWTLFVTKTLVTAKQNLAKFLFAPELWK